MHKAENDYHITFAVPIIGKRYITITAIDSDWQLRGEVRFPSVGGLTISPLVN
jgi:hypothetical protein